MDEQKDRDDILKHLPYVMVTLQAKEFLKVSQVFVATIYSMLKVENYGTSL